MSTQLNLGLEELKKELTDIKYKELRCLLTKIDRESLLTKSAEIEIKSFIAISSNEVETLFEEIAELIKTSSRHKLDLLQEIANKYGFTSLEANTTKLLKSKNIKCEDPTIEHDYSNWDDYKNSQSQK